jgi:hypothetical protein
MAGDTAWVVVTAIPDVAPHHPALEVRPLIDFVRAEATAWPAPIPLAAEPPQVSDDRVWFRPSSPTRAEGGRYHGVFHRDGSALIAVAVGSRRESPSDLVPSWAVGEGAVAWILVAALHLAAGYADRRGTETFHAGAVLAPPGAFPIEIWNHDQGTYGPAGRRLDKPAPAFRDLATSDCRSSRLVAAAQPLLAGVLDPFGLAGDRHLDPAGALRRDSFTGFGEKIRSWADSIGVPSRP